MIKCNATLCGEVCREATHRTDKDGKAFTTFALTVPVPSNDGSTKTVEVSVSIDGTDHDITPGTRLAAQGTLLFKKRGEALYLNLHADTLNPNPSDIKDGIVGELHFRGKTGKSIDERTDKKGNPYIQFSAFSSEKVGDGFEHVWVRFFRFDGQREPWLQPAAKIEAKGEMDFTLYKGKPSITCKVASLTEYVKPPYTPND